MFRSEMEFCRTRHARILPRFAALSLALAAVALAQQSTQPGTLPPAASATPAATKPAPETPAATPPSAPVTIQGGWLRVTAKSVNVRSRPDLNSTPVTQVNRDDVLWSVGEEFGWYAVVPPSDVFCFVGAQFVERQGESAGVVKISEGTLRVREGTRLRTIDPAKADTLARLPNGAAVDIVGEQAEWLMIKPPPGVFVYISDQYVEKISNEIAASLGAKAPPAEALRHVTPSAVGGPVASRPSELTADEMTGTWGRRLARFETDIQAQEQKPALDRTWDVIADGLRPIAAQREEPQVAEKAARWLDEVDQKRIEQDELRKSRGIAERDERERGRLDAETRRLEAARTDAERPTEFTVMGLLRPSFALPAGEWGLRYKLIDPITQKVRAYVEIPDSLKLSSKDINGKYVGVVGEKIVTEDFGAPFFRATRVTVLTRESPSQPAAERP